MKFWIGPFRADWYANIHDGPELWQYRQHQCHPIQQRHLDRCRFDVDPTYFMSYWYLIDLARFAIWDSGLRFDSLWHVWALWHSRDMTKLSWINSNTGYLADSRSVVIHGEPKLFRNHFSSVPSKFMHSMACLPLLLLHIWLRFHSETG